MYKTTSDCIMDWLFEWQTAEDVYPFEDIDPLCRLPVLKCTRILFSCNLYPPSPTPATNSTFWLEVQGQHECQSRTKQQRSEIIPHLKKCRTNFWLVLCMLLEFHADYNTDKISQINSKECWPIHHVLFMCRIETSQQGVRLLYRMKLFLHLCVHFLLSLRGYGGYLLL